MLINEIKGKLLKKPLEVTVSKEYIAECEDLDLYGEGYTEEATIEDLKETFLEMHEGWTSDEFEGCEEQEKKYREYLD